ncbi:MAG: peptidyl-prolyl cis-trans isomerase, partial [Planctomycetes bacterium]|nr:peptidyl-prolyl cis-trans isomerase [Planctomycetota bacterium]
MTKVRLETSKGNIVLELDEAKAPVTVANFLKYVDEGFYDGTIFHRVIASFMVQGGGFDKDMKQKKTHAEIVNESANGLENKRGAIAMARTSAPNSASSQFFINIVDNAFLNKAQAQDRVGYCVFGSVVEGIETLDLIKVVKTGNV